MVSDGPRGSSPRRGGPMRNNRGNDRNARLVPYTPKRIKGSPSKRCYVNNLPYECKWQDFKDHMKTGLSDFILTLFLLYCIQSTPGLAVLENGGKGSHIYR